MLVFVPMKNWLIRTSGLFSLLFCGIFIFSDSVHAAVPIEGLSYCHGPQDFDASFDEDNVCYTVESGDTLWAISDFYLGSGTKWKELDVSYEYRRTRNVTDYLADPRKLQIGTKINFNTSRLVPHTNYRFVDGSAVVHPNTGQLITWSRNYNGDGVLNSGNEMYAGPYAFVKHLRASTDGRNISYLAKLQDENDSEETHGYQFVVNGKANEYLGSGYDYKLLTYSADGSQYAVRNNIGTDPEQFLILSSIGNSQLYSYIDSLFWFDDQTLVYRAQIHGEWRVVVNHQDDLLYNYLENLKQENGTISFDARHDDQSWTHEIITLDSE